MILKYITIESDSEISPGTLSMLYNLDQDFFPTPWAKQDWMNIFNSAEQRLILGVKSGDMIIGFALFDISSADSFSHLLKIVVDPKVRSAGVGKNLLTTAIRILIDRNIKSFFLEVEEHNTAAINLYKSLGFKIIHQKKQFYTSGATALIMTLST